MFFFFINVCCLKHTRLIYLIRALTAFTSPSVVTPAELFKSYELSNS